MQEWIAFFIAVWERCIDWLERMTIFDVSLIQILVAIFVLGVIFRALLYKA